MEKVAFLFCVHNHQPVGNFLSILEEAYRKAYLPFIEILQKYPFMKISIHYSGILWDFFKTHHPEFLEILRGLVEKGQLEMMTGGYYEPILTVIPDEDKVGQIRKLSDTIQREMGVTPEGMWLAERVWEPHLPKYLKRAGVEYIAIDDYHFKKSGLREEDLYGYYLTEEEGDVIKVFPGSERLRYIIPFHPPEETLDYLRPLKGLARAAIFADDGEKFGIWPYTYHSVYEEGWLDRFFQMIGRNLDWIEPLSLGSYLRYRKPLGRIYLPCSSYMEMDEWSLPTEAMIAYGRALQQVKECQGGENLRRFMKGGFWRNFFAKYPESNDLHKRVLHLRKKIEEKRVSPLKKEKIISSLYPAQCNDGYWHGVFGGLYLPHLRHALYENLIRAENLYDKWTHQSKSWMEIERGDLNGDKEEEVLVKTPKMILLFRSQGGSLSEMDWRLKTFNILNTLTRRKEGYHQKLIEAREERYGGRLRTIHEIFDSKEEDLDRYLHFDPYRKVSFLDHFISSPLDFEAFRKGQGKEEGDFIEASYEMEIQREGKKRRLIFSRLGNLFHHEKRYPLWVRKQFLPLLDRPSLEAYYQITLQDRDPLETHLGIEFNINLLAGEALDRYYEIPGHFLEDRRLASSGECRDVLKIELIDEWVGFKVILSVNRACTLWRFPIETVSLSESGFERVFQGSCLVLIWPLNLKGWETFEVGIELGIYPL
ncbi:MAG: alpha-amylase/4-alpha-glucanotransferase domain-containing protein [Thermodesulfobacteriota bacterium]